METIKNTYFKTLFSEGKIQISGDPLPDPAKGPYEFKDCEFHPRLWEALRQMYRNSILTGSSYAGSGTETFYVAPK
jgi:hypothetical protein